MNRALMLVLPVASIVALGCNDSSGGATPAASSSAMTSASALAAVAPSASAVKPHPMFGRHGGIAAGLFRAAHELTLTDEQKDSLDKIEATLKADDDAIRGAMKTFRSDLIAGVKAGKIDSAKTTADDAVIDKAFADHQTQEAAALDSLHQLLDSTQRAAAVASVRARNADREKRMMGWMQAKELDGGAPDFTKKRLAKLTNDLSLDAGQQKQVAAILAKQADPPNPTAMQARWDDHKKRTEALLTGFASDAFDAKAADLKILPGKTAHETTDHMVAFFTALLPVLHPDQRDKLAATMDRPFGAGGGPGVMGMQARSPVDDMAFPFEEPSDVPSMPGMGGMGMGGMPPHAGMMPPGHGAPMTPPPPPAASH
jgi:Spy/CpxP family protein refolding chaperone